MIDERDVIEIKQRLACLESLMEGERVLDGKPGIRQALEGLRDSVHGPKTNPGGLTMRMDKAEKRLDAYDEIKWKAVGAILVLVPLSHFVYQMLLKVFTGN